MVTKSDFLKEKSPWPRHTTASCHLNENYDKSVECTHWHFENETEVINAALNKFVSLPALK